MNTLKWGITHIFRFQDVVQLPEQNIFRENKQASEKQTSKRPASKCLYRHYKMADISNLCSGCQGDGERTAYSEAASHPCGEQAG